MRPRFIVTKTEKGKWHFTLQARNGKLICVSMDYPKRYKAIQAIHSLELLILNDRPNIVVEEELGLYSISDGS